MAEPILSFRFDFRSRYGSRHSELDEVVREGQIIPLSATATRIYSGVGRLRMLMVDDRFDEVIGRAIERWCDLDGDSQGVFVATATVVLVWLFGGSTPW